MILSPDGISKLIAREGLKLKAYRDVKGIWTIGVGDTDLNNDGKLDVAPGMTITKEQAIYNFKCDVAWAEYCVDSNVKVPLSQNQYDALVSFAFNIGKTAFATSTLVKKLNQGDYAGAAEEFDNWHKPPQIINRRNSEKEQFLNAT